VSLIFDFLQPRREFDLNLKGDFDKGITGIFGSSGAGKTSFFNIIAGIEKPKSGYVALNDRVLTDSARKIHVPIHKRGIGIVFQENLLFPHLTIRDNLLYGYKYSREKRVKLDEITDLLDLSGILDSKPYQISGGEAQRTAIGRAILTSPDLLLLDEPFNAVDYKLRANILDYIKRLNGVLDIPVLVISHDFSDLEKLTKNFYFINRGKRERFDRDICFQCC